MAYSNLIYPPIIDSNLAPITIKTSEGIRFRLDIIYNRFNSPNQIKGCRIRIVSAITGNVILENLDAFFEDELNQKEEQKDKKHLIFQIDSKTNLILNNYYKIQAAFIFEIPPKNIGDSLQILYSAYSTFGISKFVAPTDFEVKIAGLGEGETDNLSKSRYTGEFVLNDLSERVKEYRFLVYENNNLYYSTDWLIHDNSTNFINEYGYLCGQDYFDIYLILKELEDYEIQYEIKTVNNLIVSSPKYVIANYYDFPIEIACFIYAKENQITNGIEIFMQGIQIGDSQQAVTGNFLLLRSEQDPFSQEWAIPQQVLSIYMDSATPSKPIVVSQNTQEGDSDSSIAVQLHSSYEDRLLWQDYTTQHGITYKYFLQQYWPNKADNSYCYSEMISSNPITSNFDDASLFDGEKQLLIKYNPKITSFKTTKIDSKQDTIGSKYPFIFRGGNTNYKEFSISGLISYTADELGCFDPKYAVQEDVQREETPTRKKDFNVRSYDLTSDNFAKEQSFKIEVLDWLNDGKVKLFKSPSEGNYLVRLMNVSLTPVENLGRLLHTFSCTAYEVADLDFFQMVDYKLIQKETTEVKEYKIMEGIFSADGRYPSIGTETFQNVRILINEGEKISFYNPAEDAAKSYFSFTGDDKTPQFSLVAGPNLYQYEIPVKQTGYFILQAANGDPIENRKIVYDKEVKISESGGIDTSSISVTRSRIYCSQICETNEPRSGFRILKNSSDSDTVISEAKDIQNTYKFYTMRFESYYFTTSQEIEWGPEDFQIIITTLDHGREIIDLKTAGYYEPSKVFKNATNITYLAIGPGITFTWSGSQSIVKSQGGS